MSKPDYRTAHTVTTEELDGLYETVLAADGRKRLTASLDVSHGRDNFLFVVRVEGKTVSSSGLLSRAVEEYNNA